LRSFERGSTIRFKVTFENTSGTATDPIDNKAYCTVVDPSGTKQLDYQLGTRSTTGVYYYDYTVTTSKSLGIWKVEWEAAVGTLTSIGREQFRVVHTEPGTS